VLAIVESVDRGVRRVRPITADGVLALERTRHRGPPLTLADGRRVATRDPIGVVHLRNDRVRDLADAGWQSAGMRVATDDLHALARWIEAEPRDRRPIAFRGVTLLAPLARRFGWEARATHRGRLAALERWYQAGLLARWSPQRRARLARGRARFPVELWISADEVVRRYGSGQ
jgi:hypothetical protein